MRAMITTRLRRRHPPPHRGGGGTARSAVEGAASIISMAFRTIPSAVSSILRVNSLAAIRITVTPWASSHASQQKIALRPIADFVNPPVDLDREARFRNRNRARKAQSDADDETPVFPASARASGSTTALRAARVSGEDGGRCRWSLSALSWSDPVLRVRPHLPRIAAASRGKGAMRSMVEGARLRSAAPNPLHRASRGPPPPRRGRVAGEDKPYATLTFNVLVVSLPRMSMTLTTTLVDRALRRYG